MIGQVVSFYEVLREIGAAGTGVAYEAQDLRAGRRVALKFLPHELLSEPGAVERFRREAEAIALLNHSHVCTLYDVGEHDGHQFLVFELADGRLLTDVIHAGPLPVQQAVRLSIGLAEALEAAHSRGIVHRDVKPSNIQVTESGDAKLMDFGLAALDQPLRGERPDGRSDLYSLGAVMFEMVTGTTAGAASSQSPSQLNPAVPEEFSRIVLKALDTDPARRYQTAREMAGDLRRLARDMEVPGAFETPATVTQKTWGERLVIAASVLVLLVGGGTVWLLGMLGKPAEQAEAKTEPPAHAARASVGPPRLVVLPFENLTRRSDDDWLAGAFSDRVSAALERITSFILVPRERVIELYSGLRRRESDALADDVARQLSQKLLVRYYVHGSYQRVDDDLRVVARLIDINAGGAIQAQETILLPYVDVLQLEDMLASRFATRLGATTAPSAGTRATAPSLDAYRLLTDARGLYARDRFGEATSLLRKAVEIDPRYALAWAWLAKSNARLLSAAVGSAAPAPADLNVTLEAAKTAASLDANEAESHLALAMAYRDLNNRLRWRESANRAIELDPRHGEARVVLGDVFAMAPGSSGCPIDPKAPAAEDAYREGIRVDPLITSGYVNLAAHQWWMGRRAEALAVIDEGLAAVPESRLLNSGRPFNLFFADRIDEADALLNQRLSSGASLTSLEKVARGFVALRRERFDEAKAVLHSEELNPTRMNLPFTLTMAVGYFEAGRRTEGIALLARAISTDKNCANWARLVPALASFRNMPEFLRTVRR